MHGLGRWRDRLQFELSETALDAVLVAVTLCVQLASVIIAGHITSSGSGDRAVRQAAHAAGAPTPTAPISGAGTLTMAGLLLGVIVFDSLVLYGLYRIYQRLPERWQAIARTAVKTVFVVGVLTGLWILQGWPLVALAAAWMATMRLTPGWIRTDIYAVITAVFWATVLGVVFAPPILLVLFVSLIAYDLIAVHWLGYMLGLGEAAVTWRLPALLIIPKRAGFSTGRLRAALRGHASIDGIVIGVGDLAFPAALVVSAAVHLPGPMLELAGVQIAGVFILVTEGIVAATLIMRSGLVTEGWAAGLPFLNTGAMAGYTAGVLAVGIPASVAFGVPLPTEVVL